VIQRDSREFFRMVWFHHVIFG